MSYAIAFDLKTDLLREHYGENYGNAYGEIQKFLEANHYRRQQGSLYFGDENTNAVHCVMTAQKFSENFTWFSLCVSDIRMLRIEENNDLKPALSAESIKDERRKTK